MRVALALGAGGARGYAHIGVIEVLEQRGFEIVAVAGSSMGAVIGGLYTAGKLPDYAEWVRTISQRDVLRMLDPTLTASGAFRGNKVLARITGLLDGARIEQLPISFTAVATDLLTRQEVWLQHGPVDVAIRASVGIPAVVTPVVVDGRLLADGALTNPLPIAPTLSAATDAIVAVSLSGRRADQRWDRPHVGPARLDHRSIRRGIARRMPGGQPASADRPGAAGDVPSRLGKLDMMALAVEAMHDAVTRHQLASYPPDLLIEVPTDACRSHEFHRAAEMIDIGRRVTEQALQRAISEAAAPEPAAVVRAEPA